MSIPSRKAASAARNAPPGFSRVTGGSTSASLTVRQSAAIPYRLEARRRVEVLLVTGRRSGDWIIPKGNVERDLGPARSAAKEALEEAGVVGRIGQSPVGRYVYNKRDRDHLVDVFDLLVRQEFEEWDERGQRQREWVSVEEAVRRVAIKTLREVIGGLPGRLGARA